jgi:hypothetical protein
MTDLKLTPEDQQELGDALDEATAAGQLNGNLKDAFCGCWPTVKALLNWIKGLPVSQRIKEILGEIIEWGDFIHGKLCPNWKPE